MKIVLLSLLGLTVFAAPGHHAADVVAYPEGYRSWAHVRTTFVDSTHPRFASIGGFQHFYANAEAMRGHRTRVFPEGSVLVVDWLDLTTQAGASREGARRQLDVMVRDSVRFASTGGWGFRRFQGDSHDQDAAAPTPSQCFACHAAQAKDGLVLSTYRP